MKLCRRRTTLEIFIKWCHSSSRDLPSFYDITGEEEGEPPQQSHSCDNLLLRKSGLIYLALNYANAAVADIICHEVDESLQETEECKWKSKMNELVVEAYRCFVRLNCPLNDNLWQTTKFKQFASQGAIAEVETLCKVFMVLNGIRSRSRLIPWEQKMLLLSAAAKEAEKISPSIAQKAVTHSHKKKRKRRIVDGASIVDNVSDDEREAISRKFIVRVPKGLKEGDDFYAIITSDISNFSRKVRLVATATKKLMFNLEVPTDVVPEVQILTAIEGDQ